MKCGAVWGTPLGLWVLPKHVMIVMIWVLLDKTGHRSEAIFYRRHKIWVSVILEYAYIAEIRILWAMARESNTNDIADFDIDEVIDWDKHDIPSKVC